MLELIAKYWVQWICTIIAGGIALLARHHIKLQKEAFETQWSKKEEGICNKIVNTLEPQITRVEAQAKAEDEKIHQELNEIHQDIDTMSDGILSIQGKQFKDYCERLLKPGHFISIDEYEEFESDYEVYKKLKGNHRGDALHARIVEKFSTQSQK